MADLTLQEYGGYSADSLKAALIKEHHLLLGRENGEDREGTDSSTIPPKGITRGVGNSLLFLYGFSRKFVSSLSFYALRVR
ncbi:MAG: hypothetical protein JRJ01_15595 [Deltaproteobacteria bacterium]|nr:hypothetical protein [Deltaproteobacteria bacterium]